MYKTVSIIIPASSNSEDLPVLSSLENIDYPKNKIEIVLSIGRWPSAQRNRAAKIAKGDILYFLNRNSRTEPAIFKRIVSIINSNEKIAGVGGPDLTPKDNSYMQHLFGYAMGSYFAHWKMRARYSRVGIQRFTNEKELLLSNLATRRDVFLKVDGFNETLYPNEENELISKISKEGYKFIYSPDLGIYRDRRKTLFAFVSQFYKYGQGRMNQIFIEGALKNLQFFMPLLLIIYFLFLPFIKNFWISFIPLFIYTISALIDTIYISFKNRKDSLFLLPIIYIIMHISYGAGMLHGLLQRFRMKRSSNRMGLSIKIVFIKTIDI